MQWNPDAAWARFQERFHFFPELRLGIDLSRMGITPAFLERMEPEMQKAFQAMAALEQGAIANPDEQRRVGHYWLRKPELAPEPEIRAAIEATLAALGQFAIRVHQGELRGARGSFANLLVIGIGGSALGPQFVAQALGQPRHDRLRLFFFDNTDPDGFDRTLAQLAGQLGQTLCLVISKSGGTKETRNGMLEAKRAFEQEGLPFPKHAVAITGEGSELDRYAENEGWLARFPMWDWVGGRTSETSAVGLLPAFLQGIDGHALLAGAAACDELTRRHVTKLNPAALLALAWFASGNGKGEKTMVVLPYKDRLELFSKYLQQLIMESLGKEKNIHGEIVHQGISVFGNKGSTDQHAYVQQLREGLNNFFVTFIEVMHHRSGESMEVEPGTTSGDYLHGFFMGTRDALSQNGRESLTITIDAVTPFSIGVLIALFERAVGLYASMVHINAYHQPGVEAGKRAAGQIIDLQAKIIAYLRDNPGEVLNVEEISARIGATGQEERVFKICEYLAVNRAWFHYTDAESMLSRKYWVRS